MRNAGTWMYVSNLDYQITVVFLYGSVLVLFLLPTSVDFFSMNLILRGFITLLSVHTTHRLLLPPDRIHAAFCSPCCTKIL